MSKIMKLDISVFLLERQVVYWIVFMLSFLGKDSVAKSNNHTSDTHLPGQTFVCDIESGWIGFLEAVMN